MIRIVAAAVLFLAAPAQAADVYPCSTASSGGTTYAYCPYSGTCYEVADGAVTDISGLDEEACLAQADGRVVDTGVAVEEVETNDRALHAEVCIDGYATDEVEVQAGRDEGTPTDDAHGVHLFESDFSL